MIGATCVVWRPLRALDVWVWRTNPLASVIRHLLCTEQCGKHCEECTGMGHGPGFQWIILEERQVKPQCIWKRWDGSMGTAAEDFREKLGLGVIKLQKKRGGS